MVFGKSNVQLRSWHDLLVPCKIGWDISAEHHRLVDSSSEADAVKGAKKVHGGNSYRDDIVIAVITTIKGNVFRTYG